MPVDVSGLHVSGNHLVDGSGQSVILRGASISGTEFSCVQGGTPESRGDSVYGNQPLDQPSTYKAMAAWHINVVRIPLNEDCWLGIDHVNAAYAGTNYQAAIKTEVGLIHATGMHVILDLHWSSPGSYSAQWQQPMADADHSLAFWSSVATSFRNDHHMIFELYNEPFMNWGNNDTTWRGWLNGMTLTKFVSSDQTLPDGTKTGYQTNYSWRTAGIQPMIDAIRATGASQPVIANGVGWANDLGGWLAHEPADPAGQLIAGLHDYPGQGCALQSCWTRVLEPIRLKVPLLVGETGDNIGGRLALVNTLLPWADANGVSYVGWTWNPWRGYPSDVLITSWDGTPTAVYGQYFHDHLVAVAS